MACKLRMDIKMIRVVEIGPCAHNVLTIPGSILNIVQIGQDLYFDLL